MIGVNHRIVCCRLGQKSITHSQAKHSKCLDKWWKILSLTRLDHCRRFLPCLPYQILTRASDNLNLSSWQQHNAHPLSVPVLRHGNASLVRCLIASLHAIRVGVANLASPRSVDINAQAVYSCDQSEFRKSLRVWGRKLYHNNLSSLLSRIPLPLHAS